MHQVEQDSPHSPESLLLQHKSVALKTRLAIGGSALEVDNRTIAKVPSIASLQESFGATHENTESRIAKASVRKRLEYWEKQEEKEESEQMKKWKTDVVTLCHHKTHLDDINTLSTRQIGGIDWNNITDTEVGVLHEKYFGSSQSQTVALRTAKGVINIPSGTNNFVHEVVASYTKEDGTVDYASLQKDRSSLEFAAGIFGIGDLLFEYIDTITTLQDEERTQALINQANQEIPSSDAARQTRINELNTYEVEQLRLLSEGYEPKIETPPPSPKPTVVVDRTTPLSQPLPAERKPVVKPTTDHLTHPVAHPTPAERPVVIQPSPTDRVVVRPLHTPLPTREQPVQPTPIERPVPKATITQTPTKPVEVHTTKTNPQLPTNPWPEKIYVATPEQLIAMPTQERMQRLPEENLRAAIAFCNGLRARITNNGRENKIVRQGQNTSEWIDEPTRIHILCPKREQIIDSWFSTGGFTTWADHHRLPLIYLVPGGLHATLFLGMEKRQGKLGYLVYNPATKTGEQWNECTKQLTIDQYIEQQIQSGKCYRKPNGELWIKANSQGLVQILQDHQYVENVVVQNYLNEVTGIPTASNTLGGRLFMSGQYDLSLGKDQDLSEEVVAGKIQQMQFDAKNCTAISFFAAALRYTAKPGNEQEKIQLIQDFYEDFPGIRFLTRKEILEKKQQTKAQPIVLSSSTTHSQAIDRIKFGTPEETPLIVTVPDKTDLLQLTARDFDNSPIVVSYENNLARARDFIRTLDEARTTARPDPNDNRFLINKFNFRFESNPPYWYDVLSAVTNPGSRYGLPIMIYTPGNHANLVLKIFKSPDGQYKMVYWDPMSTGDKGKNLSPVKVETLSDEVSKRVTILAENRTESDKILQANHIYENDMVISHDNYDLTIAGDRELADPVIAAKLGAFQTDDARNCVPLCIYAAMLRQAAKYTKDNHPWYLDAFFERGLDQFYEDFKIPIATREQLQKRKP